MFLPGLPVPVLFAASALLDRGAYTVLLAVLTGVFGLGQETDAFFIATGLPMMLAALTGDAGLVVLLRSVNDPGSAEADRQRRVGQQLVLLALAYAGATLGLMLAAGPLTAGLAPGLTPAAHERTADLLRVAALLLPVHGLGTAFANLLIARGRMVAGSVRLPLTNLFAALAVAAVGLLRGPDLTAIVAAMVAAGAVVSLGLGWQVWPASGGARGVGRPGVRLFPPDPGVARDLAISMATISGSNLMHGLVLLIERGVASTLAPGMVAAVGLARTMVPLISTIPSAAATGGFAAALAGGSGSGSAAGGPGRAMVYAALLPAVPILVVLLARTEAVIGVLFEHGRFTGADTGVVSAMALLFAGSAPYLVLATPLSRALQAARLDRAYLGACLAGFAAYGPLAVGWGPDRGALGLILAYGVAMNLHLLVMAGILSRRTGSGFLRQPWGRLALAGLGAAGAVAAAGQIPAGSYLGELALAGLAGAAGFGLTGWLLALPGLRHRWRAPAPATGSGPAPRPPVKVLNCLHRSHFGGTHWRVIWIAEALRRHGVETTVLFPANPETEYQRMLEARGIPFRRLPLRPLRGVRRVLNNLLHLLELPLQVLRVARLVRREGFDLVYVNSLTNLAPLLGARLAGRPVVWHWNDMLTPRAYARLVRPLLTRPSGRLVVAARAVALHYRLDREAEPPPVLSPPLPPAPAGGVAELPFEAAPGEAVVGFVSNLVAPKGCHEFLETIAQLRRQGLAVRGVMVGGRFSGHEGYARRLEADRLRLGLAEAVSMVGYRTDVERWMRRFDVLLFPSHTEAAPITVIQALGVGLPLVATRVGFVEEMLAGTGLPVVAVGDVPAMVAGLRALLALGPEERAALAERMRAVVAGQFAIEAVAGRHLALYASLLPGRLPGVEPA